MSLRNMSVGQSLNATGGNTNLKGKLSTGDLLMSIFVKKV
jgi:hypothetical protein